MSRRRLTSWEGSKHPDHDEIMARFQRVGQVWEDRDEWVYFVVGEATVATWESDGRPSYLDHRVMVMNSYGEIVDWDLQESVERPLETRVTHTRLA